MIIHASIPADRPQHVAEVLAELWRGEAVPFPPVPNCWMAYAHDGKGTMIEVAPRDQALVPGPEMVEAAPQPTPRHCAVHLLVQTVLSADEVLALGQCEGWLVRRCHRGGPGAMGFDLIELWVENAFMLEVATAEMVEQYVAFNTTGGATGLFGFKKAA